MQLYVQTPNALLCSCSLPYGKNIAADKTDRILTWLNSSNPRELESDSTACIQEGHREQAHRGVRNPFPQSFFPSQDRNPSEFAWGLCAHNLLLPWYKMWESLRSCTAGRNAIAVTSCVMYWNENLSRSQLEAQKGLLSILPGIIC